MKITVECKDIEDNVYGVHLMISREETESEYFDEIVDSFIDSYANNFNKKLGYSPVDLQWRVTDV